MKGNVAVYRGWGGGAGHSVAGWLQGPGVVSL